jgi:hypothetical protein
MSLQERDTEWVVVTPVPVSGTPKVPFEALLVIVKVPEAEPLAVGVKPTVNWTDWLTPRVKGVVTLPSENPVPATLTAETLTDAAPVLVIVAVSDGVLLVTFPKLNAVGLDDNVPRVEATPVPVSATVNGWTDETVLAKTRLPAAVPVAAGVKTAV